MTVYLDLAVLLNFVIDLMLLLGTNRLAGFPAAPGRSAGAAALGAVYGGACLLPGFFFLGNLLWRVVCMGLMGLIAFGWNRSAVMRTGLFVLLSMALGGLALAVGSGSFWAGILCAVGLWLLCAVGFGGKAGQREYMPLRICREDREVNLIALRDTGNTLCDPITGEQVLIIGPAAAAKLTGLTQQQLASPLETMASKPIPGLRIIPYRAVGRSGGMLLALRFRDVQVGKKRMDALVAFAPEGLETGGCYQALTGGAI